MSQRRFPHHTLTLNSANSINNAFDWFQAFPITKEAENQTQLLTPLSTQVLNFVKPFLQNFYPGQTIYNKTHNQNNIKSNFNDLLQNMISSKPQFLSEFIHQNKSNILPTSISPNYLLVIFKDILLNFTTTFFTKLNY